MEAQRETHKQVEPKIFRDGNKWCAMVGPDLQKGTGGFGDTPELALKDLEHEVEKRRKFPKSCS